MNFSYWEKDAWFTNLDYTIVGSGIVGISCALYLRKKFPNAQILIIEKGLLPNGASTKNAGFACFGSISEILDDLKKHSEEDVVSLIKKRVKGLTRLREIVGDKALDYQGLGGYELFTDSDTLLYEECIKRLPEINALLYPLFRRKVYSTQENNLGFKSIQPQLIYNAFEGQIDTGKMMRSLLKKAHTQNIKILNNLCVNSYTENANGVDVITEHLRFKTKKLLIATNGFASELGLDNVEPARAQVLITNPIPDLKVRGTFHLDKGYYYFRNINNRILLGGGRNLDFQAENTTEMEQTALVQNELERLLQDVILPDIPFTIDQRWSGIMGVGKQKKPIVRKLSARIYCGVRLGGMGVAIGSLIGEELADLVITN